VESRPPPPGGGGGGPKAGSIQSTVLAQINNTFEYYQESTSVFSWVLKVTAFLPLQKHRNKEQTKDRLRERERVAGVEQSSTLVFTFPSLHKVYLLTFLLRNYTHLLIQFHECHYRFPVM